MKTLGERTIDDLRRIVLPLEIMQAKGWGVGDKLVFNDYNGVIVIEASIQDIEPEQAPDLFSST